MITIADSKDQIITYVYIYIQTCKNYKLLLNLLSLQVGQYKKYSIPLTQENVKYSNDQNPLYF